MIENIIAPAKVYHLMNDATKAMTHDKQGATGVADQSSHSHQAASAVHKPIKSPQSANQRDSVYKPFVEMPIEQAHGMQAFLYHRVDCQTSRSQSRNRELLPANIKQH